MESQKNLSILFCTPAFGGQVFAPYFKSCMQLTQDLTRVGLEHDWLIRWNESLIQRARMGMTAEFLKTNYSHMMWLDADIEFTPEDVAKLWNMDADIAVGVYCMKKEGSPFAAWQDGKLITNLNHVVKNIDGIASIDYAGTGFMMIKREVIEDLSTKVEKYENEMPDIPALYMTPIRDGYLVSEDYYFCALAREHGYKVLMDTNVRLGHWGLKRYGV